MPASINQTANTIYNISSINTAKFIYEAYNFNEGTVYNIEHIEHAEFLFKSADYQELETKIKNLTKLVAVSASEPEELASFTNQLHEAELQKQQFIEDVKKLYITLASLQETKNDEQFDTIRKLFNEGKFREANILLNLADLKLQKKDSLQALEDLKNSLENNAEKYLLKARLVLTDLNDKNRIKTAMECFEESIDNSKRINSPNTYMRLYDYGEFLSSQGFATKAITYFSDAITELDSVKEAPYTEGFAAAIHDFIGELYMTLGNYKAAETYLDKSVNMLRALIERNALVSIEHLVYVHDLIAVYNNRGSFKWQARRLQEAYDDYSKCDYLFKQLPEEHREASNACMAFVYNNLGNVYYSSGYYEDAETLYVEAYTLLVKLELDKPGMYTRNIALSFNNIAWAQSLLKKYNEAQKNYTSSIAVYKSLINKGVACTPDLARAYCNFGMLLHAMQLYKDAVKEFRKAKKIYNDMAKIEPNAYLPSLATVLEEEGKMFYETKDFKNALNNFEEALVIREYQAANDPLSFSHLVVDVKDWIKEIKNVAK